jgi:small-conductance mechanosensitive channel
LVFGFFLRFKPDNDHRVINKVINVRQVYSPLKFIDIKVWYNLSDLKFIKISFHQSLINKFILIYISSFRTFCM